ncbi:MAG: hypothetical protein ACRDKD_07870, partial [Solirubrobacteraceae bacterium]
MATSFRALLVLWLSRAAHRLRDRDPLRAHGNSQGDGEKCVLHALPDAPFLAASLRFLDFTY